MSETTEDTTTTPPQPTTTETAVSWETAFEGKTPEEVKQEIDKWKHFSRKNEDELNDLKRSNMTEAEKAVEAATQAGRDEGQKELTKLRLENAAIKAGVPEHLLAVLDVGKLVVNGEIQTDLLKTLAAPDTSQFTKTASDLGLGAQTSSGAGQYTREQIKRMTPAEINEARDAGKLNDLMTGRLN